MDSLLDQENSRYGRGGRAFLRKKPNPLFSALLKTIQSLEEFIKEGLAGLNPILGILVVILKPIWKGTRLLQAKWLESESGLESREEEIVEDIEDDKN